MICEKSCPKCGKKTVSCINCLNCGFDIMGYHLNGKNLMNSGSNSNQTIEKQKNRNNFNKELKSLLNRYSKERDSYTPDFILAEFLLGCLDTFNKQVNKRDKWKGVVENDD